MKKKVLGFSFLLLLLAPVPGTLEENPHNFQDVGCTHCHLLVPGSSHTVQKRVFRKNIDSLCQECHEAALEDNLNHRVGVRPSMRVPEDLHLSPEGKLSCITCHNPHAEYRRGKSRSRSYFLRRGMLKRELCMACHSSENYRQPTGLIEILAPLDNSILSHLPVPLIGKVTDPLVREVTLDIDGSPLVLDVRRKVFSTVLTLREGINMIKLSAPGVKPLTINLFYNPKIEAEIAYRLYRSHGIVTKKDCTSCHTESSRGYRIEEDNSRLCNKCHEDKGRGAYVHGPVAVGSCTVCHDPHGQTNPYLLVRTGEDLCFQCHTAADALAHLLVQGAGDKSFLRERGCNFCHDPHNGERKFLLRSNG